MRLVQVDWQGKARAAVVSGDDELLLVNSAKTVYELALEAIINKRSLSEHVSANLSEMVLSYSQMLSEGKILAPVTHKDPSKCMVSGTGLTHLGSAESRNSMHAAASADEQQVTDSMRMFNLGLESGKPDEGEVGAQPEWFYKGDGYSVVAPEQSLPTPNWVLDAGEEPEIAGIYVIGPDQQPYRIGFAIGNEYSDHVTEKGNYLWLAHSKLRFSSFGPELLVGDLPAHIEGTSRIVRNGEVVWQKTFLTGEDNMSHSITNLEHHHFKYAQFCQPGNLHVHFFGTATASFGDAFVTEDGDQFEIEAEAFGKPLRNQIAKVTTPNLITVNAL